MLVTVQLQSRVQFPVFNMMWRAFSIFANVFVCYQGSTKQGSFVQSRGSQPFLARGPISPNFESVAPLPPAVTYNTHQECRLVTMPKRFTHNHLPSIATREMLVSLASQLALYQVRIRICRPPSHSEVVNTLKTL